MFFFLITFVRITGKTWYVLKLRGNVDYTEQLRRHAYTAISESFKQKKVKNSKRRYCGDLQSLKDRVNSTKLL